LTSNETASVNENWGPPFRAMNRWPSSSNSTVRTGSSERSGRVVTFVIFELGKTEV